MVILDILFKFLEQMPTLKRLEHVYPTLGELEDRLADLEERLAMAWPAGCCRYCGTHAAKLTGVRGPGAAGGVYEDWHCTCCGQDDVRMIRP